jgi:membrane-bound lytic murein transglycosylase F
VILRLSAAARRRRAPIRERRLALALLLVAAMAGPLGAQTKARTRDDYDEIFRKYSKRFFGPGFDWQHFKAQGMAESNLAPAAKSHAGARGIMQLMPSTYQAIQSRQPELEAIDDPESNIAAGIMYDRDLWRSYQDHADDGERLRFMLGGYNAGPGTMRRAKRVAREATLDEYRWQSVESVAPRVQRWRYRETLGYVTRIEQNYQALRSEPSRINAAKPAR